MHIKKMCKNRFGPEVLNTFAGTILDKKYTLYEYYCYHNSVVNVDSMIYQS